MPQPTNQPGPGRSTSEAALNDIKKAVAQRNDEAQRAARKLRAAREEEAAAKRRRRDLL
jgi:translation elongation factor EF-Ts